MSLFVRKVWKYLQTDLHCHKVNENQYMPTGKSKKYVQVFVYVCLLCNKLYKTCKKTVVETSNHSPHLINHILHFNLYCICGHYQVLKMLYYLKLGSIFYKITELNLFLLFYDQCLYKPVKTETTVIFLCLSTITKIRKIASKTQLPHVGKHSVWHLFERRNAFMHWQQTFLANSN